MKISIVIVTMNRKALLEICLNKLLQQHLRPFEIIVVDNGSSKEVRNYIENVNFTKQDIVLKKIFFCKNMGLTYARNRGAEEASANIIVWMDNDTYFEDSTALEKIYDAFKLDDELGILTYPVHELLPDGKERYLIPRPHTPYKFMHEFETSYFLGGANSMQKSIFKKYGMFDEKLIYQLEELDFIYRISSGQIKIKYVPHIEITHVPPHKKFRTAKFYYFHMRNRIWIAFRYLPQKYLYVHLILWIAKLFSKSILDFKTFAVLKGIFDGIKGIPNSLTYRKQFKLSKETINWLKQRYGRIWY